MDWNEENREPSYEVVRKRGLVIRLMEELHKSRDSYAQPGGMQVRFYLSPKIGSRLVGITSGIHKPGDAFEPHVHPLSEELLVVLQGKGEIFLYDKWIPVQTGDVVYAPEGVPHGTRNHASNSEDLIMIGIAVPPQLDLYFRSGYYSMEGLQKPFGRSRVDDPPAGTDTDEQTP